MCLCDLMDAPYPGAPGKKPATFFCYCSNRIWKQTKRFLADIVGFYCFFPLLTSKEGKKKHNAFSSSGALYLIFPVLIFTPSPMICWTFLCDPCIMMVYFPKVKSPVLPRISWKGGCFLWFLSGGSWVRRLLEKERPWGSLKIVSVLQLKKKGS